MIQFSGYLKDFDLALFTYVMVLYIEMFCYKDFMLYIWIYHYRRSSLQTIVSKISPVLAGIIAYLDTNNNLDLVFSDTPWIQDMWIKIVNTEGATQLKVSFLVAL